MTMKRVLAIWLGLAVFGLQEAQAYDAAYFNPVPIVIKAQSGSVPIGTVIAWPVSSNPPDADAWLECNGQSTSGYPELAALVGAAVPDYRGMFLRGYGSRNYAQNNGSTIGVTTTTHSSGALGVIQGDAIRNMSGRFSSRTEPEALGEPTGAFAKAGNAFHTFAAGSVNYLGWVSFDPSRVVPTASENRPVNVAVRYLIRAK